MNSENKNIGTAFPFKYLPSQYPDPKGWKPRESPSCAVIVGCSATKRDVGQPVPARDLYDSDYFDKRREFAELAGDDWVILSAEHGILDPGEAIEPYNTRLGNLGADGRANLIDSLALSLGGRIGATWPLGIRLIVLAGRQYVAAVDEALAPADTPRSPDLREHVRLETPLQDVDGGIGAQKAWLADRLDDLRPTQQADLGNWGVSA
jgi:hypothetical protein